jgi:hypothetical protein
MRKYNFMENLRCEDMRAFQRVVFDCIIFTDNKLHFQKLNGFRMLVEGSYNFQEEDCMVELLGMSLHACDFYGNVKPFEVSSAWSRLLVQEMVAQLEEEARLDLPQTEYFKGLEHLPTMAQNEEDFITKIVQPLWSEIDCFYLGEFRESLEQIESNRQRWAALKH